MDSILVDFVLINQSKINQGEQCSNHYNCISRYCFMFLTSTTICNIFLNFFETVLGESESSSYFLLIKLFLVVIFN